ncbi:endonuclease III [Candidatus Dojkabacteria bacterium]|nr:endonuclease III [Candidatus Dojkabacteria bacterium]
MNKKEKAYEVLDKVQQLYPDPSSELGNWETPFQFLVCVALSAQTTDKQVNKVTKRLFEKYPDADSLSKAELEDVQEIISSINYYKNKAKYVIQAAKMVIENYVGSVPRDINEVVKLPGVGYKTANVFLSEIYEDNQGIAVDTHVFRVAHRLNLSKKDTPGGVADDLEVLFDKKDWHKINGAFVLFGRYTCKAKSPKCDECPLTALCEFYSGVS